MGRLFCCLLKNPTKAQPGRPFGVSASTPWKISEGAPKRGEGGESISRASGWKALLGTHQQGELLSLVAD